MLHLQACFAFLENCTSRGEGPRILCARPGGLSALNENLRNLCEQRSTSFQVFSSSPGLLVQKCVSGRFSDFHFDQNTFGKHLQMGSAELSTPSLRSISQGERPSALEKVPSAQTKGVLEDCCVCSKTKKARECICMSLCQALDHTVRERVFVRRFFVKATLFDDLLVFEGKKTRHRNLHTCASDRRSQKCGNPRFCQCFDPGVPPIALLSPRCSEKPR